MIGVIAPYTEFKEEVEKIAKKLDIPIVAETGALRAGLSKARKMIKDHDVKIIVARASTANFLQQHLDVPIIKVDITNFDIIKTLKESKKLGDSIVLMSHVSDENRIDIETINELLNLNIEVQYFENERDILSHFDNIAISKREINSVVGTAECIAITAGKKGMKSFVVFTQEESITEALLRAKESLKHVKKEEIKQKHLETVITCAFDGVLSTNADGQIIVCNDVAANYIGVFADEIMNRHFQHIQIPILKKLFGNFQNVTRHIISHGNQKFVLNRNHLGGDSYVITFQEVEKIIESDSKIRSQLYHRGFLAKYNFDDIVHESVGMKQTISLARAYSKVEGNILIYGESGTGKELLAQSIHNESNRVNGPFVAINCAALPDNLLESELFGYVEGAFTGAKKGGKPGLFEMAHKGTIFLDEIGEISQSLQARLLRVLQEREVMRIGGEKIIPVDVRVIAATNKNLNDYVKEQKFRSDLYYRLNILYLAIPPLRQRMEDLDLIISHLLNKHGGKKEFITDLMRQTFYKYSWPGNIRELENLIERIVALKAHLEEDLPINVIKQNFQSIFEDEHEHEEDFIKLKIASLEEMETEIFDKLLEIYDGNKSAVAEKLGISRTTLWKKSKVN